MERHTPRKKKDEPVKRRCHRCRGLGRAPCRICNGSGKVFKGRDSRGNLSFGRCEGCFGTRNTRCTTCNGEGFI